jgi:hypothetical protein
VFCRYCTGQYPPALDKLIASRRNFKQLEDFNVKSSKEDEEYNKEYMDRMSGKKKANAPPQSDSEADEKQKKMAGVIKKGTKNRGCFGSESVFSDDKVYLGGPAGSNIKEALMHALNNGKKYFAISRSGLQGHAFAFDELTETEPHYSKSKCKYSCMDISDFSCGCSDDLCAGLSVHPGEENLRRWMVYEVKTKFAEKYHANKKAKEDL